MSEEQLGIRLSEFVGRTEILNEAEAWLQSPDFRVVFLDGSYGIGKTRLLQQVLELAKAQSNFGGVPNRLVDFYHFSCHTAEGLARAILAAFEETASEKYFGLCVRSLDNLEEARMAGGSGKAAQCLEDMLRYCVEGLRQLSEQTGVLLLFDTVEQYVYPGQLGFAPAWEWLKNWVFTLPRGAAIFAGRSEGINALKNDASGKAFLSRSLDLFTPEETRKYINAVAREHQSRTGQPLSFLDEDIDKLHRASGGRPIWLALCLQIRACNPEAFTALLKGQPQSFEQGVINSLLSVPDLGETLKAAGRVPRGLNAELLAGIRGISRREAESALGGLGEMAFAKTFPNDERIFLHDEMYILLQKYVYSDAADAADRASAGQKIYRYYKEKRKQKDEELSRRYRELAQPADEQVNRSVKGAAAALRELEMERRRLKIEMVYYRLRYEICKDTSNQDDPIAAGLKRYYRYAHEAATSGDDAILRLLQIELSRFLAEQEAAGFWQPFMRGLLLMNEFWLKAASGQQDPDNPSYEEAFESLQQIPSLDADQCVILQALLKTWRGTDCIFSKSANYRRAKELLSSAIQELSREVDQRLEWFKNVVISLAYRQLGYLNRILGDFSSAIVNYQQGLRYSRRVDFIHEEATLRNDLGFAQMRNGQFVAALENMKDGLQLRYQIAIATRIVLSYQSLSQCYLESGVYEESRRNALSGIRVAEAIGFARGVAFGHYTYAEALRRLAFAESSQNAADYLRDAQEHIDHAVRLFEDLGEQDRIIDSKLEQACLYRDRLRAADADSSMRKSWFDRSNKQLLEVAKKAKEARIAYRQADAMCNRIWLGYYMGDFEFAKQAIKDFEELDVLKPYWFSGGRFNDEGKAGSNAQLWAQVAKFCAAQGMIALKEWEQAKSDEKLRTAARHLTLAMMYNAKFAVDHRGVREGRRTIHQALVKLNEQELSRLCRFVLETEQNESVPAELCQFQKFLQDHALWFVDKQS